MSDFLTRPESRWTGHHLHALPAESALSSLLRFAWLNGQNAGKTKKRINNANLNNADERQVKSNLGRFWFSERLRICPICMEGSYHSFWYQFIPLKLCPLHNCLITDACQHCGMPLPRADLTKKLFSRPYICNHCDQPFAGGELMLRSHIGLRESATDLAERFQSYLSWAQDAPEIRGVVYNFRYQSEDKLQLFNQWCQPDELLMSLWHSYYPLPAGLSRPPYAEVTLLKWKIWEHHERPHKCRKSMSNDDILRLASSVYRTTLRSLQNWLMTLNRKGGWAVEIAPNFHDKGVIDLQRGDLRELAYMLLRFQLETEERWGLYINVRNAQLEWPLQPRELIPKIRTTRLGWRAFFLGVYAGLFYTLQRAKSSRFLSVYSIRMRPEGMVLEATTKHNTIEICGAVAFPTIPGMPLWPFRDRAGTRQSNSKPLSTSPAQLVLVRH